ncbi:3-phosphoglycerate dehydrogenase family protein [Clostridium aminobutyricum]|uniref:3-phosphoglycerate dehydrogenase n=1 Tax=Clostridium aminobutyricum TaxID=33953 RepID=A0A939D989_CLOAM|nr:3-phosphoglycerate dehydrogenase family protein [Clostridium aminobutyricum]MBN7773784.1 3-phosphoglycerate dehydrogenase [Clostridium aminobutyricum]
MYKIATLNKISPVGLGRLTDQYTITDDIASANGILVRSHDMLTMDFSDNLLAIARAGAGVNNIPIDRCAEKGIVVFNTPGANANAVKELVLTGLLLGARNVPDALGWCCTLIGTEEVGKAVEKGKAQFAGTEIHGKTLGVIGLGSIGVLVANAAQNLGMQVIGYDPYMTLQAAHSLSNEISVVTDLGDLLPECDYITIHVPAVDSTKGIINADSIAKMKSGVILLNFSRDKLVNDADMLTALDSEKVRKYITDFPNDKLIGQKGVVCIPHLGASTEEAEDNCAMMAADELMDYIENGNIRNSVNFPACSLGKVTGTRICVLNKNDSSVLNSITGAMSEMNLNVTNMVTKSKGDFACALLDVDGTADEAVVTSKLSAEGIIKIRVIKKA